MNELGSYLERLAGRSEHMRKHRHYELFQRRNQIVDQFGVELNPIYSNGHKKAEVFISISPDLLYYSKWEFKIVIEQNGHTLAHYYDMKIAGVPVTTLFKAQYGGWWCWEPGFYPNSGLACYDVLKACGLMSKENREKILSPGYKRIEMTAENSFDMKIINYLKYSFVSR